MFKIKPPCKECERNGCGSYHNSCEKYLEWKKEHDRLREQEQRDKALIQPSSILTLGDARLSYKHFNANNSHSKHKQKKY